MTALKSNSNTVWFNFQTYIYLILIYIIIIISLIWFKFFDHIKLSKWLLYIIKQYKFYFAPVFGDSCIWTTIMLYTCISHEEDIVFALTIKINLFFMILRSIAISLMSPLNIIQQRYLYWNDLTVCIVSLYNLLLCILLLYNHCNDFAPWGTLIGIKNSLSYKRLNIHHDYWVECPAVYICISSVHVYTFLKLIIGFNLRVS